MRFAVVLLLLSACASPPYEPLVCDDARADDDSFGYVSEGGLGASTEALLIGGDCRFWVKHHGGPVRVGVLTADELEAINAELLTGPWSSVDGLNVPLDRPVSDVGRTDLWRDDVSAHCEGWCQRTSPLAELERATERWIERLHARGDDSTGPMAVSGSRSRDVGGVAWRGVTPLLPAFPPLVPPDTTFAYGSIVIEDPGDLAMLRTFRESIAPGTLGALSDDGVRLDVLLTDLLPARAVPPRDR